MSDNGGFLFNPSIRLPTPLVESFLGHHYRMLGFVPPCRWNLVLRLDQSYYCSPRHLSTIFPRHRSFELSCLSVCYLTQHLRYCSLQSVKYYLTSLSEDRFYKELKRNWNMRLAIVIIDPYSSFSNIHVMNKINK